jgi:hypothetical protein
MSDIQQTPTSKWWPKHLAQRRWYGWVMAVVWCLIFLMAEIGVFFPQTDVATTEPESMGSRIFAGLFMVFVFYAIYWFFMMITYYVSDKTKETYKFIFNLLGL